MDKRIIAIALVAIVAIAAVAAFVLLNNNGDIKEDKKSDYISLGLTNDFFPDHTCCVIAANYNYLNNSTVDAEKFLAGYHDAVLFVENAIKNPSSDDYKWLVSFSKTKVPGLNEQEIKDALSNITYLYADGNNGNLAYLEGDIASLVGGLKDVGALQKNIADPAAFAGNFVNDEYMEYAIDNKDALKSGTATVKVAVISGDIHQIAVHVGIDKGMFSNYGVTVQISNATNGGGIATSLINGDAQLGFLGAPPATINMINFGYIDSESVKDTTKAFQLVARVNSEGSGLYINSNVVDDPNAEILKRNGTAFFNVENGAYSVSSANAKAWGGLVYGTPGTTSIQHIQLLTLANEMGLKVKQFMVGDKIESDTLYWITNLANFNTITGDRTINGGIIWEPQFQRVIQEA
ncbi:MAG: ABC transporter substrate-binding protein [Candidatus Methanomethylophilaceae archaeon]|nr:ABC transporter substrate-binding protein [Candidatus Methanomethylophilaceae archaeon]